MARRRRGGSNTTLLVLSLALVAFFMAAEIMRPVVGAASEWLLGGLLVILTLIGIASQALEAYRRHFVPAEQFPLDGHEFEHWCAARLRVLGWRCKVTPPSGDQGADIIAERGRARLVIQCKRQSAAVGNKAVQEIATARRHYRAEAAAVIATSTFTRSAASLAKSNDVLLLQVGEIGRRFA